MVKIGLEIHQQLDTHKLFCSCPSELVDDHEKEFFRTLRATASELGAVDVAALEEAEKHMVFRYQGCSSSCLVEADEEPPHQPNQEAVNIALEIAKLMKAKPFPETYFMRKIVIDGSNTAGFQRTALLAVDGELEIRDDDSNDENGNSFSVRIDTICLEEDAARKVDDEDISKENIVTYRLDRLGIPLIEITTAPDMHDAKIAVEVAKKIGSYLRATRKVKRGLGTIRQDVNVSIPGGTRIEIKGVQDLHSMEAIIEGEIDRQKRLLRAAEQLRERKVSKEALSTTAVRDVTGLFEASRSKIINSVLEQNGGVFALKLKGFGGLFGALEEGEPRCLGPKLAAHVPGVGIRGLFHSDELPDYDITAREVENVTNHLTMKEDDAFVLIAENRATAEKGFEVLLERAKAALDGVPPEVRRAMPDGSTSYLRPISSAARMYPETDVLPLTISREYFAKIELPELPEEKIERYLEDYDVSREQAKQLVGTELDTWFEELAILFPSEAKFVASLLQGALPELEREGVCREKITMDMLKDVTKLHINKNVSREGVFEILKYCVEKGAGVKEAFRELGLESVDEKKIAAIVREIIRERSDFVRERGVEATGPLMGVVMEKLRGKAEGKIVSQILRKEIEKFLKEG